MTQQSDTGANGNAAGVVSYSRAINYSAKGQVTDDDTVTLRGLDTFKSVVTYAYGSGSTYALGSVVSQTAVNTKLAHNASSWSNEPGTLTSTTYQWYDGAVQSVVTHDTDTGSAFNPLYTTTFTLNAQGQVTGAAVNDGIPKTNAYVLDASGQIIRHDESRNSAPGQAAPHEMFYRFGGKQVGLTGNNGTDDVSYARSIDDRARPSVNATSSNAGLFRDGTQYGAAGYADFSMSLENLNSQSQGSAGGSYTVRSGDTLASIALSLWGDAMLWYRLAEANGISGDAALAEGKQLILPAGVVNAEHNADTLKPYNPLDAMGQVSPTTPKPPKKPNCVLMLVVAAIAIAITAYLGPEGIALATKLFLAVGVKAAAAAVVGTIVSGADAVGGDGGTLFLTTLGEAFAPNRLTQMVRETIDAARIGKRGSCHLFRHTMATLMLENGADIRFIQAMLGHAELSTTQIYTQVSVRQLKAIHTATHPGKPITARGTVAEDAPPTDPEILIAALDAEAAEED